MAKYQVIYLDASGNETDIEIEAPLSSVALNGELVFHSDCEPTGTVLGAFAPGVWKRYVMLPQDRLTHQQIHDRQQGVG